MFGNQLFDLENQGAETNHSTENSANDTPIVTNEEIESWLFDDNAGEEVDFAPSDINVVLDDKKPSAVGNSTSTTTTTQSQNETYPFKLSSLTNDLSLDFSTEEIAGFQLLMETGTQDGIIDDSISSNLAQSHLLRPATTNENVENVNATLADTRLEKDVCFSPSSSTTIITATTAKQIVFSSEIIDMTKDIKSGIIHAPNASMSKEISQLIELMDSMQKKRTTTQIKNLKINKNQGLFGSNTINYFHSKLPEDKATNTRDREFFPYRGSIGFVQFYIHKICDRDNRNQTLGTFKDMAKRRNIIITLFHHSASSKKYAGGFIILSPSDYACWNACVSKTKDISLLNKNKNPSLGEINAGKISQPIKRANPDRSTHATNPNGNSPILVSGPLAHYFVFSPRSNTFSSANQQTSNKTLTPWSMFPTANQQMRNTQSIPPNNHNVTDEGFECIDLDQSDDGDEEEVMSSKRAKFDDRNKDHKP